MLYKNLQLICYDQRLHDQGCGYWYAITNNSCAHTAFRTKEALLSWLNMLNLKLDHELPEEIGTRAVIGITGRYHRTYICNEAQFRGIKGTNVYTMRNGRYTDGKLTENDGIITENVSHFTNSNEYDYFQTQKLCESGAYLIG